MAESQFPEVFFGADQDKSQRLGVVVGGSLSDGLEIKLDAKPVIEGLSVGAYVIITGQTERIFVGLITDISLDAMDDNMRRSPPDLSNDLVAKIYRGTAVYGTLHIKPELIWDTAKKQKYPVKTVPSHFSIVRHAEPDEIREIFADQADATMYDIGSALDNDALKISLNLERLVERSTAVFGRSGTGKTFLTLPLLASIVENRAAACLVFDMHNDYGYTLKGDKNKQLPGLKKLGSIAQRIVVVTLDQKSSLRRGSTPEFLLTIGYDQIEAEDLESLKNILALSDVQVNALSMLKHRFKNDWLKKLMSDEADEDVEALFESNKITESTYGAIQRKVGRLLNKLDFLQPKAADDFAQRILDHLQRGDSVVVEFGGYGNDLAAYVFVANFLTRRIHARYVAMKEAAEGGNGVEPNKLVIVIEEAHKFLEPDIAKETIFGTIARELRKYNVTLMIVDQRPSQIDAEVMSQIGTRITCALSDEKDISAVFTGIHGAQQLRTVLAALDSKQQALIMGHAVPMPVVVRTAEYSQESAQRFNAPAAKNEVRQSQYRRDDDASLI